ncbi:class I SAM-dependent methyltransferase [Agrobacterium sp. LAD9]|uniref:class I SAM-dependent methyltransferase n=1 Tax=Agrobacterium sp. LAD9 TaxID=2055153 RepID=UPI000D1D71B6|nr:class I SAM-dependent methyltransferase [Agrobacterium sp. LAD9]
MALRNREYAYAAENSEKADFDDVYDRDLPIAYYERMREASYGIPGEAAPFFLSLLDERSRLKLDGQTRRIVDIGCSYGVLAALLKYRLSLEELYDFYRADRHPDLSREQSLVADHAFFQKQSRRDGIEVIGLDRASRAVEYGLRAGLLDHGINRDYEVLDSSTAVPSIGSIDLIISTGCVGYVGQKTFLHLLQSMRTPLPWIACFVLRMFDYTPISDMLSRFGYRTDHVQAVSLRQRRFISAEEKIHTIDRVRRRGWATADREETGFLFADLFVSVPARQPRDIDFASIFPIHPQAFEHAI